MSLYTDGTYAAYHPTWHLEDSPWKAEQILKMLRRRPLAPGSVCEIGCGAGGVLAALAQNLPPSTTFDGYEIAPDAYQLAMERHGPNLHFHLADLLETPAPVYEVGLVVDVIEHVEDVFSFLRRFRSKADHKIFHIPLDFTVVNTLRPNILINLRKEVGHIHSFTKDTALALLAETGYEVQDWFYTPWAFELKSTTKKVARLNPLRRLIYPLNPDLTVRLLGGYSLLVLAR